MAMTSGSILETNLENSGQSFFTRRSKLLAFHVKNFTGSFLLLSSAISVVSPSSSFEDDKEGFLAGPSFSIGLKNRFISSSLRHTREETIDSLEQIHSPYNVLLASCCVKLSLINTRVMYRVAVRVSNIKKNQNQNKNKEFFLKKIKIKSNC